MISWPVGVFILLVMLLSGLPIAFSLTLVGFVGTLSIIGWQPALSLLGQTFFDNSLSYSLSIVPLFLMMGNFVVLSGVAQEMYEAAHAWMRHRRGGLAIATVVASGGFSSVCGSSLATAATMAKISMPSMRRFGYSDALSTASIAAGGTLGILIPPSIILVLYGIMTQSDIGKLFLAGIVPGIIGIIGYCLAVVLSLMISGQKLPVMDRLPLAKRFAAMKGTLGAGALFIFVMGGIYFGVFTPTESAAMGAFGAFLLVLAKRRFSVQAVLMSLFESAKTSAMMFFILFGALTFTNYVNLSGMSADIQSLLTVFGDSRISILLVIMAIYLVLGCLLEGMAMITLTVPMFYPVVAANGIDLIWFGIFVVVVTEISYITPPVGLNAFVLRAVVRDVNLATIFRGLGPFLLMDVIRVLLLIAFPALVLLVPYSM
ncbi:TRAP transporter large permease [Martelella lutilitoris]|uniref:TRAP transporter large permease protein n=1 Tax=Martelella lutilitoris TaxID=2583532 RepID=A0A5C4JSY3_9HYPH|nr:TRAP transporter large permease [Martelella lutilitoris]TNB48523.1 TRAP transporter large permease [Martelella lutilitoris]